jgi:hypothetical protein
MRKLVKAGLVVPMILLVALTGVAIAENTDLNDQNELGQGDSPVAQSQSSPSPRGAVASGDESDIGLGGDALSVDTRGRSSADERASRRGRVAPRSIGANAQLVDVKAWWWWNGQSNANPDCNGAGNPYCMGDEGGDEDEDDDEDMSPSGI